MFKLFKRSSSSSSPSRTTNNDVNNVNFSQSDSNSSQQTQSQSNNDSHDNSNTINSIKNDMSNAIPNSNSNFVNPNTSTDPNTFDSSKSTYVVFSSTANRRRSATCPSSLDSSSSLHNLAHEQSTSSTRHMNTSSQRRLRLNSREIPRTYSGLYGIGGPLDLDIHNNNNHNTSNPNLNVIQTSHLLPFELSTNLNTNWLYSYPSTDLHHNNTNHLRNNITSTSLLWLYISFIMFIEFALVVLPLPIIQSHMELSFTFTNIIHGVVTIIFLHWLKGSPNFYDHGELNALTLWEQLSCSPESNIVANQTKQVLIIIPTLLCYLGCKFVNWEKWICLLNLGVWFVCIVAKMENMHGVRLFGVNRTIGIDDYVDAVVKVNSGRANSSRSDGGSGGGRLKDE